MLLLLWVGCLSLLRVVHCSWNSLGVGVGVGDVKMRLLSAIIARIGRVCLSDVCRLPPDFLPGVRIVCALCPIGGVLCVRWLGPGVECW